VVKLLRKVTGDGKKELEVGRRKQACHRLRIQNLTNEPYAKKSRGLVCTGMVMISQSSDAAPCDRGTYQECTQKAGLNQ